MYLGRSTFFFHSSKRLEVSEKLLMITLFRIRWNYWSFGKINTDRIVSTNCIMSIIIDWELSSSYDKGNLLIHSGINFVVLRNSLSSLRLKRTQKLNVWCGCTKVGVDKSRVWNCGLNFAVEFLKSLKVIWLANAALSLLVVGVLNRTNQESLARLTHRHQVENFAKYQLEKSRASFHRCSVNRSVSGNQRLLWNF